MVFNAANNMRLCRASET